MNRSLADISCTVLKCYVQENWAQDESWINIMLDCRGNLQQVPANKNSISVGQAGSVSHMFSEFVRKYQKSDPQVQAVVSYMCIS